MRQEEKNSNGVNRREFLKSIGFGSAAFAISGCSTGTSALGSGFPKEIKDIKANPNFLFILADDLGWSQLGCYGSGFYETANIDRLATILTPNSNYNPQKSKINPLGVKKQNAK